VRGSGPNPDGSAKTWIAPLAPGYDKQLAGGSNCVPRNGGQTLQRLYQGNLASNPDDFGLISWNEITEGTYVAPMTRYGQQDLSMVAALTKTSYTVPTATVPAAATFPTYTYVASSRWRTAVFINGLVKSYSSQPQSARRAPGITIYLQRYLDGHWQTMLGRNSDLTGSMAVGFIQRGVYQYRLVTMPTATTLAGRSASTVR